jgi:MGT family glycosyltransferase
MERKKKIMVIVAPSTGHVNPICGLVNELSKQKGVEVIFYSDKEYREAVENTGAKLRLFSRPTFSILPQIVVHKMRDPVGILLNEQITFSYDVVSHLLKEVEIEKPDLILYDCGFLPAKYLLHVLKSRYQSGKSAVPVPQNVMFLPNFAITHNLVRDARASTPKSIWSYFLIVVAFFRQFLFSWLFGISVYNPLKEFMRKNEQLNIAALIPELQPYRDELDDTFKFVGSCVSEQARSFEITNDIELFFDGLDSNLKLIYISLGTVFNFNTFIYEKIVEAFRDFDKNPNRHFKLSQFRVVISTGEESMKTLRDKIDKRELKMPLNVILRSRVAQLEILKQADLFVTHCGMNSASEAIKYAVPMVCIPLAADQPIVAKQVCDVLSLGVRLNPNGLTADMIADSIDQVLSDESYLSNCRRMAKISEKYNGPVEGTRLIMALLNPIEFY